MEKDQQPQQLNEAEKQPKRRLFLKITLAFWGLFFLSIAGITYFFYAVANDKLGELPKTEHLQDPQSLLASEVYSADGETIGRFFSENRTEVAYQEISPYLINALIATEDIRYYEHSGIDFYGLARVAFKTIALQQSSSGGGSTITQQLAKNLFHERPSNKRERILQKFKEYIIAVRLERHYTKEEIITLYLNTVDFGSSAFGIKSASQVFFNKKPAELDIIEASVLVGVLKGTTMYSPVFNKEKAEERKRTVLGQLKKYDFITPDEFDSLKEKPIVLNYKVQSHTQGIAQHFREHIRAEAKKWSRENGYNIYEDGLKIYTTIDSRMQRYAEEVVDSHMAELQETFYKHWEGVGDPWGDVHQVIERGIKRSSRYATYKLRGLEEDEIKEKFNEEVPMRLFTHQGVIDTVMTPLDSIKFVKYFLHTGFIAMEPSSGHIKAWVGGIDYRFFKYDHASPRARRQVGSAFKPFVYTVAAQNGYSPCFRVANTPIVFEDYDNWTPKNHDGKYGGMKTLKSALASSINTIVAYLIKQVGPESVIQTVRKMGISSPMDPVPSICLGTMDISVYEMVAAYNTYANKGSWVEPIYISRIEDKNGNVLKEFIPRSHEVIDENTNYVMVDMLRNVVRRGTAVRIPYRYKLYNDIAGKTGTTQNNSDGWFMGFTPEITAGVWVGADDRAVSFRTTALGGGSNMALPIWARFMQKVYADDRLGFTKAPFEPPSGDIGFELDCDKIDYNDPADSLEQQDGMPDDIDFNN